MPHFDTYPITYWLPVYALCWALLWLAARSLIQRPLIDWKLAGVLSLVLLFLLRLSTIVFNAEINPDESQMITQAFTLYHDPVYFRSVDGTTGGPLDSYFLILPGLIGLPFDYITAHFTAFCLVSAYLWLLFVVAGRWFGRGIAPLVLLPFVFMLGLTQNGDFLHYNSELVALLLLGLSYYLYATLLTQQKPSVVRIGLIGLLLGMVPFGKLQAIPLAAVVGLFVLLDVLTRAELTPIAKVSRVAWLGAGSIAFPLLVVLLTTATGVYDDFVTFYLKGNFQYGGDTNQLESLLQLPTFLQRGSEFDWLVKLVFGIWLVGFILSMRRGVRTNQGAWRISGFIGALFVATVFAITRTGSGYVHYLFFIIGPLFFSLAYGWQQLSLSESASKWIGVAATAVFLGLFGVQAIQQYRQQIPLNRYPSDGQSGWTVQQSPVSRAVRQYAKPGEKLAVWGWRCDYYVQANMQQGVAENHTIRSAFAHPMQAVYKQRYVADFIRSTPPVFVDAVGSQNLWMNDRKTQGHELIKPLGQFVATHYKYMGLVNDTRIYVRNDRVNGVPGAGKSLAHAQ